MKNSVDRTVDSLSRFTELESETYRTDHFTTYFAKRALMTVFTDSTERSPTFRLHPLDTVDQECRKSWIQVWTEGNNGGEAWQLT